LPAEWSPLGHLIAVGLIDDGGALTVEPLTGGYWNQLFHVRGPAIDWVVKRYHGEAGPARFPNLPEAEAAALRALAPSGAVPRFIHFAPAGGSDGAVLVYGFAAGRVGGGSPAALAEALASIHAVPMESPHPLFRPLDLTAEAMLAEGAANLAASPDSPEKARLAAVKPAPRGLPRPGRLALVHTDCGPGNLVEAADGKVIVIDWQTCGLGDPAEDLYAMLSPAFQVLSEAPPREPAEKAAILAAYRDRDAAAHLPLLTPFYAWRMLAYCLFRTHDLKRRDPAGALRYAQAFEAEMAEVFGA